MPQLFGSDNLITDIIEVKPTHRNNLIAQINYKITVKWLTRVPVWTALILYGIDFN